MAVLGKTQEVLISGEELGGGGEQRAGVAVAVAVLSQPTRLLVRAASRFVA
jgi:hypothetical protein